MLQPEFELCLPIWFSVLLNIMSSYVNQKSLFQTIMLGVNNCIEAFELSLSGVYKNIHLLLPYGDYYTQQVKNEQH